MMPTTEPGGTNDNIVLTPDVRESPFLQQEAATPLRVTCYGSSSSQTPLVYRQEAFNVGYILARRGHTCVNGAGSFGCMAAMNEGAATGNGHIVGVIHEMWLKDYREDSFQSKHLQTGRDLRDGGAHPVFDKQKQDGPVREMIVAGGKDLQERKRLLVENAQALVVLPGGPGTWDELWEAACARNIGLATSLPIVCVNIDNFYGPFRDMLQRAYDDELTKLRPDEIVHFENTAEGAIRWVEEIQAKEQRKTAKAEVLRESSFLGGSAGTLGNWSVHFREVFRRLTGSFRASEDGTKDERYPSVLLFTAGLGLGVLLHRAILNRRA